MNLLTYIQSVEDESKICLRSCKFCDRSCIQRIRHRGDCECKTDHTCLFKCDLCKDSTVYPCSKVSGHKGIHIC